MLFLVKNVRKTERRSSLSTYTEKYSNVNSVLDFYTPKKDRCDTCEEWLILQEKLDIPPILKIKFDSHTRDKIATKKERDVVTWLFVLI